MKTCFFILIPLFCYSMNSLNNQTQSQFELDSFFKKIETNLENQNFNAAKQYCESAENLIVEKFGKKSSLYARILHLEAKLNHLQYEFYVAEKKFEEAIQVYEGQEGINSLNRANVIEDLGQMHQKIGRLYKAEKLLNESFAIKEQILGRKNPAMCSALSSMADLMNNLELKSEAISLYEEALFLLPIELCYSRFHNTIQIARILCEQRKYKQSDSVVASLPDLSLFSHKPWFKQAQISSLFFSVRNSSDKHKFAKSDSVLTIAKEFILNNYGKDHPNYIEYLIAMGNLLFSKGIYSEAEAKYVEAKTRVKHIYGKDHQMHASILFCLGMNYNQMGDYSRAEAAYLEVQTIYTNLEITNHINYGKLLTNLANLYSNMGDMEKAEMLYIESYKFAESKFGRNSVNIAKDLNNLAIFYHDLGNFERSEILQKEALTIRKDKLGINNLEYARSLNNLGYLFDDMGRYQEAKVLLEEALVIREKFHGKSHPHYATTLDNLGVVLNHLGELVKAENYIYDAMLIRKNSLGKEHPYFLRSLYCLGLVNLKMGNLVKAKLYFSEAEENMVKVLGKKHEYYVNCVNDLATIAEMESNYKETERRFDEIFNVSLEYINGASSFLSEFELLKFIGKFESNGHKMFSILNQRIQRNNVEKNYLLELAYNYCLVYKGFLMNYSSKLNNLKNYSSHTFRIDQELKVQQRKLTVEFSKPLSQRNQVDEIQFQCNQLKDEMAVAVSGYADATRIITWKQVQEKLKPDEIAIEFINFPILYPNTIDSNLYVAMVVRPDGRLPQMIPLFYESELNYFLDEKSNKKSDFVNELFSSRARGVMPSGKSRRSLYEIVWNNIEATGLERVSKIYFSPCGVLNRINLPVISIDELSVLSDKYSFVTMSSTRQIVYQSEVVEVKKSKPKKDILIFGNINYEVDSSIQNSNFLLSSANRSLDVLLEDSIKTIEKWQYLYWTKQESEEISSKFKKKGYKVTYKNGHEASEDFFKKYSKDSILSPNIIHVATHGFFYPDINGRKNADNDPVFKWSDNPMIRSGLILANANYAWENGHAYNSNLEDGILTSYEISQLNLSNTDLVVLSACETGLGEIKGNEGVYGLQRAFKTAGVKNIIMSLWQVPDQETKEFMTTFYRIWLSMDNGNIDRLPEAFLATQKEMRARFLNPYQWAGFVLIK